ncbi:hypothetical protein [Glycomyces buryatensis]|uniref:Uncharacterized protein n=1 Tax=Glycomyces buryatensis TaxID=2570927 RepID=A0A4V4HSN5_9ACTN|nr:hypothetical protein [Glycomyces buryatensis]THV42366.1 hypothetical protein FAB82_06840 [Glycomyces buryatensis]
MLRMLLRLASVAVLAVGIIAMHAFGHPGGHGEGHGHIAAVIAVEGPDVSGPATAHGAGHSAMGAHAMPVEPVDVDPEPVPLMSFLSVMVCGAILVGLSLKFLRAFWSRLPAFVLRPVPAAPANPRRWALPPPELPPTGLRLNRIAVLRI